MGKPREGSKGWHKARHEERKRRLKNAKAKLARRRKKRCQFCGMRKTTVAMRYPVPTGVRPSKKAKKLGLKLCEDCDMLFRIDAMLMALGKVMADFIGGARGNQ